MRGYSFLPPLPLLLCCFCFIAGYCWSGCLPSRAFSSMVRLPSHRENLILVTDAVLEQQVRLQRRVEHGFQQRRQFVWLCDGGSSSMPKLHPIAPCGLNVYQIPVSSSSNWRASMTNKKGLMHSEPLSLEYEYPRRWPNIPAAI